MLEAKRSRDGLAKTYRILIIKKRERERGERERERKEKNQFETRSRNIAALKSHIARYSILIIFAYIKYLLLTLPIQMQSYLLCAKRKKEKKEKKRRKKREKKKDTCLGAVRGIWYPVFFIFNIGTEECRDCGASLPSPSLLSPSPSPHAGAWNRLHSSDMQ